jgi:HdeA/HdeB family
MKLWLALSGLGLALLWVQPAEAQETADIAKITCDQFLLGKVTDSRTIAIWLNGYYNGAHGNTVIDPNGMGEGNLIQYCLGHSEMPVLDAVRNIDGAVR